MANSQPKPNAVDRQGLPKRFKIEGAKSQRGLKSGQTQAAPSSSSASWPVSVPPPPCTQKAVRVCFHPWETTPGDFRALPSVPGTVMAGGTEQNSCTATETAIA